MANKNLPLWENFDEEHSQFMTDFLEEAPLTLHFHFNLRENKRAEIETSLDEKKHSVLVLLQLLSDYLMPTLLSDLIKLIFSIYKKGG